MPKTITLKIPDSLMEEYGNDPQKIEREVLENFVAEQYRTGKISTGEGAEMLGISYWEFLDFLGERKIQIGQDSSPEERAQKMETLEKLLKEKEDGNVC